MARRSGCGRWTTWRDARASWRRWSGVAGEGAEADVFAVFTRGEEGGLFGARLMAQAGTLPADTVVVSLESSPVIPGVAQGEGPVIRTGDAMSTFDGGAERALTDARQRILDA